MKLSRGLAYHSEAPGSIFSTTLPCKEERETYNLLSVILNYGLGRRRAMERIGRQQLGTHMLP